MDDIPVLCYYYHYVRHDFAHYSYMLTNSMFQKWVTKPTQADLLGATVCLPSA